LPFTLDSTQALIVASKAKRIIVNCCRQWGKTSTIAAKVASEACTEGGLILIIAPVERQANELFRKAKSAVKAYLKGTVSRITFIENNKTSLELSNGARIVALPAKGENIRGFTNPRLVVIDEAAFVKDEDYRSVRPMLSHGARLIVMSTPFGMRGWFYETWHLKKSTWEKYSVAAADCSHIETGFLDEERVALGPWWYSQEYECQFLDSIGSFFDMDAVREALDESDHGARALFTTYTASAGAIDDSVKPLFG
jgi:phage FluMu gp28-like protein